MSLSTPVLVRRVAAVDALRGFALLGILLVNSLQIMDPYVSEGVREPSAALLDRVAVWLVMALAASKFYLLFSFLFGYSFTLQMSSADRNGANITPRFLRRSLGLLMLGLAHAVLLYNGDILMTYGVLGLALLAVRRITPATATKAASWIYVVYGVLLTTLGALPAGENSEIDGHKKEIAVAVGAYRGTAATVLQANVDRLPDAFLGFFLMAPGVLAAFLLGLAAGKVGILTLNAPSRPQLVRITAAGLALGVPGAVFSASTSQGPLDERWQYLGLGVGILTAPALSAAYACGILLLLRSSWGERTEQLLNPAGRLALTNYLTQSVVMTVVATSYGLSLYGRTGAATVVGLACLVYVLQLAVSAAWFRRFRQGPAEWLLRTLTRAQLAGGRPRS
ncbi:DUF418 domain-containing protein [Streptomyces graminilatus]|uniref:DUF418 domain-containing protein n=1 Tax=Streptomyces graminilatus TaxID=1464070 RepID=UPI0006E35973|nr:DUF418 domain-containing protein [Streptomyces graminilatus]